MSVDNGAGGLLYPLTQLYAFAGEPLPRAELIDDNAMPQPYRSLLVHDRKMTTTLEEYSGCSIHLKVLQARLTPEALYRKVLLVADGQGRPIEFGAIRINLPRFQGAVHQQILEGYLPLGAILHRHRIPHASRPTAFFVMEGETLICEALGLTGAQRLYGRHNVISSDQDEVLAEVVEILPPLGEANDV